MRTCDALVVGGGPAGASCAAALGRAGWTVIVADAAEFPRDKVCAGWLTPEVFGLLDLTPDDYRGAGLTLQEVRGFSTRAFGQAPVETRYDGVVSYAIRRREFDAFLLARAGVPVEHLRVTSLRPAGGRWIVNEEIAAPVVVGAGGHFCPVAKYLRGRDDAAPVVAKEAEFRLTDPDALPGMPALYFCRDLAGYAWCVRKEGWVNVGLGRRISSGFGRHVDAFAAWLARDPALAGIEHARWKGHAYLAAGAGTRPLVGPGMLAVGDAAGLAYPESGEGIRPAIASGQLAAATLVAAGRGFDLEALRPYAEAISRQHPPMSHHPPWMDRATAPIARLLLRSSAFTRHVVLDRWFLRRQAATPAH